MRSVRTRLQLEQLETREVPSANFFPSTTSGIALFSDQLNSGLSNQLVKFIASHYDGTQKMLPTENARYVADNPNWTLLDYRLATASGPVPYITGGQWGSDWSAVTANESWFMHDASGNRLYDSQWNWYLNDISNPQFLQYWVNSVLADLRTNGAQGVFADSFTAGIGDGWFTVSDPRFSGTNAANPSAWPGGVTWVQQQQNLINYVEAAFRATPEQFKYIPNLDALVTGWYNLDTSNLDGAFLEDFGDWGPSYLSGAPSDWVLSMNRALSMSDAGKILIMQPYLKDTPDSATGQVQRGFEVGTYLLLQGQHTYLNLVAPGGSSSGAYYYPEYGINLGSAVTPLASDVSQYLWDGVYRRDFQNGVVLVNPTNSAITVNMGQAYQQVTGHGGGALTDASLDANGNYIGGTLTQTTVQTITVAPGSSAILLKMASAPAAPTGLTATAASSSQVNLSWGAVSGASSYTVQRSPDGNTWTQVAAALTTTTYADTSLQPGTVYYYRVQASNSAGSSPFSAAASVTTPAAPAAGVLFSDSFSGPSINPAWKFVGGSWGESNGVLAQTSTGTGDPKKALLTDQNYPANVVVTAKVRVDSWAGGDSARAGISLDTNPATGQGYNLVFHNNTSTVQFLDDGVAWGNSYAFNWSAGTWYRFKLEAVNGTLYGKVWRDGSAEPSAWMFTQAGWTDRTGGAPGLNGGTNNGATASFASVTVSTTAATPPAPAAPTGLTATAASSSQVNLSWGAVSGASSYSVQRSPDGSTWAAVASGLTSTTYADTGLQAATAYYYRVQASNSAGSSPFSTAASATTPAAPTAPPSTGGVLFSDSFSGPSINPAWKFVGGSWGESNGVLAQTSTGSGDPKKALLTDQTYPAGAVVTARVRVDSWAGGDSARAGISLDTNPATGQGYNLVFHNNTSTVQFLDDGVAWGNSYAFNWSVGTWYWFQLEMVNGTLYGKIWQDGTPEPTTWMFTQTGWKDRAGGAPGLNGGTNNGATASFEDVTVTTV